MFSVAEPRLSFWPLSQRCLGVIALTASVLFSAALQPVHAIDQSGRLDITVFDEAGDRLLDATLTLSGEHLMGQRYGHTDSDGHLTFRALPAGKYSLEVRLEGYQGTVQTAIIISAGRTATLSVVLHPGSISEIVTVIAEVPLIDPFQTASQYTYDRAFLDSALPGLGRRNQIAPLLIAPGVKEGSDPRVRGSGNLENVFLLDGVDTGNPDPMSAVSTAGPVFDAIQEVQFQTGAIGPELGRATGGVANVITKSGGNDFSGSFDLRYSDHHMLQDGDHFDPGAIRYRRAFTEATLGGPVVHDRLWFFVAIGDYRLRDGPEGSLSTSSGVGRSYFGKLTWQISPLHKLSILHNRNDQNVDNYNAGPLTAPEALGRSHSHTRLDALEYLGIFASGLILHGQAAAFDAGWNESPQSGDTVTRSATDFLNGMTTRNFRVTDLRDRSRKQLSGTASWSRGKHTLKGGLDLQRVTTARNQYFIGNGWDIVAPDSSGAPATVLAYDITSFSNYEDSARLAAFFLGDEWRIADRWTANLGLRYDGYAYLDDLHNVVYRTRLWQPRFGSAWNITGDARNVIKATYGRFGQPTNLNALFYVNENHLSFDVYANEAMAGYLAGIGPQPLDLNGDGMISDQLLVGSFQGGGTVYARGGRLDGTYVEEFSASYERALGSVSVIGITAVRRKTRDLIEDHYPDPDGPALVIDNLPGLERKYSGLELRYRSERKTHFLTGSYTLSRSVGNIGLSSSWGSSPEYDLPVLSENRWGYMPGDARHSLRLNGYWTLPRGLGIGYAFNYHSGFPYTVLRPAVPFDYEYPEGRGSRRLPGFNQLDLEFRKDIAVGKSALRMSVTVLNVLDSETVTSVNPLEGSLGIPLLYQQPRRIELGTHISF